MSSVPPAEEGIGAAVRSLTIPVLVPAAVFGVGQGAAMPVVALSAVALGATTTQAALVAAATGAGLLLGDLPAGRVVARWGERLSIIASTAVGALGILLALCAVNVVMLGAGVLLSGCAMSVWTLARQTRLAVTVPLHLRARIMSLFATCWRSGALVGPFVGAAAISVVGVRGGFAVQLVAVVVSGALIALAGDNPRPTTPGTPIIPGHGPATLLGVAGAHRAMFATLGTATLMLGAARVSRDVVIPLWGTSIGLEPAQIALILGIAGVGEVLISTPAGHLMDRRGRRAVATPCLAVLAIAYATLPLAGSTGPFLAVVALLAVGNGLGNGVVMTIGADIAPSAYRTEFLASWRLMHDGGTFAGPLVLAAVASASLGLASIAVGLGAAAGAVLMWVSVPRYVPRPETSTRPTASSPPSSTRNRTHTSAPIRRPPAAPAPAQLPVPDHKPAPPHPPHPEEARP